MKHLLLQTRSLFISAGHSTTDPGATANGYTEADIVLDFRDELAFELNQRGIITDTDGEEGENLPLSEAVGAARSHDVAVEFHCNSFHKASASGVETLSSSEHYELGGSLCTAVADALGITNRGPKGESSGQHSRLAFIRDGGGIIVELFFISNPGDLEKYRTNKDALVDAVAEVLIDEVTK